VYFSKGLLLYRIENKTVQGNQALMQHPTPELLIRYTEHQLPEADRAALDEHLALPCPQCRAVVARLGTVLQAIAHERSFAPPASVLRRAFSIFRKRSRISEQAAHPLPARLLFDSRLQPSLVGVRGPLQNRQILFRVGKIDIDLQIAPDQEDRRLVGQILGSEDARGGPSAFVSLTGKGGDVIQGAEADHLGQFAFRRIPSGTYDLVFDIQGQEIAITDLDLGNDQ
jgi:hypothetical protein